MHEIEKGFRLAAMNRHQAGKRRAMLDIELLLDTARFREINLQKVADIGGHLLIHLREEITGRRIKRVVEVEDPGIDMVEAARKGGCFNRRHGLYVPLCAALGKFGQEAAGEQRQDACFRLKTLINY